MNIPWIPTDEYVELLRSDPRFIEVDPDTIKDTNMYKIDFIENMELSQEENNLQYSKDIVCFKLKKEANTEKYFRHLQSSLEDVYLLFEKVSRYTHSDSEMLFIEERLRQGLEKKDIEEKGTKYKEYLSFLDEDTYIHQDTYNEIKAWWEKLQ